MLNRTPLQSLLAIEKSMRQTNKPRSRNKGNRRHNGNVINRVFESSGPDGKVRGNPQQIIEKYQALSRDSYLTGDRVMSENYAQHAEHYIRMLRQVRAAQTESQPEAPACAAQKPVSDSQIDAIKVVEVSDQDPYRSADESKAARPSAV